MQRMINVVLVQPEIPPNTGNIIRLCANTGARLHLVEPLGFPLDHAKMRRAGLDYHEFARIVVHPDWATLRSSAGTDARMLAITTRGHRNAFCAQLTANDWLVFGSETKGLPAPVFADIGEQNWWRIPMQPGNRSMNLSNAVAVMVFEAWRQQQFIGASPTPL